MRRAIGAARRAFDEGPWPRSSREDRARALLRIADAMERRKEEMRQLLVAEAGATAVTHSMQVDSPIEHLRHWADLARTFAFEESLPARASMGPIGPQMNNGVVYRQPVGVCGHDPHLELPGLRHRAEARARAGHRLHDGVQAVAVGPADQPRSSPS